MALQTIQETWWDEYQVHLADLDIQHKRLEELLQELEREMRQAGDTAAAISSLTHYTSFHFADEEQYMEHWRYPGLAEHTAAHCRLLEQYSRMAGEVEAGTRVVTPDLVSMMRSLMAAHLEKEDRKYNEFLERMK